MYKYKPLKENEVITDKVNEGFPIGFIQTVGDNIFEFLMDNPQAGSKKLFSSLSYLYYVVCELCSGATMEEIGTNDIREHIEEITREFWNLGGYFDNGSIVAMHKTITKDEPGQPEPKVNKYEDPEEGTLPYILDEIFDQRIDHALELIELGEGDTELLKLKKEVARLVDHLANYINYIELCLKPKRESEGS